MNLSDPRRSAFVFLLSSRSDGRLTIGSSLHRAADSLIPLPFDSNFIIEISRFLSPDFFLFHRRESEEKIYTYETVNDTRIE